MSLLEVAGQGGAIARLERARRADRQAHGYIFSGPEGVGKFSLARQWGKLQLCASPVRRAWPGSGQAGALGEGLGEILDCCDACAECRLVDAGTHPDFQVVDRDLVSHASGQKRSGMTLTVEVVRDFVIKPAGGQPGHGRGRVFVIDQAESMNAAAQNALLKTLEEPPVGTYLVLVSSQPEGFLPTIRSRCHTVEFCALSEGYVRSRLVEAGAGEAEARYWAGFSQGRLGVALRLRGLGVYGAKVELMERLSRLEWGDVLDLGAWLVAAADGYGKALMEVDAGVSGPDAGRKGKVHWLEELVYSFREAMGIASGAVEASEVDQGALLARVGSRLGVEGCERAIRATLGGWRMLGANVNATLLFESLVVEYCRLVSEAT